MVRIVTKEDRPFVICVEMIDLAGGKAQVFAAPVGVEIADSPRHAFEQAVLRWPHFLVLEPYPWESLPPKVRLAAIKADS